MSQPAAARCRAIVVDDDTQLTSLFCKLLLRWDVDTDVFHDGAEAIISFRDNRYTLALVDLELPATSGRQVLHATRGQRRETTTLVVTGSVAELSDLRGLGVAAVLAKPVEVAVLTDIIRVARDLAAGRAPLAVSS